MVWKIVYTADDRVIKAGFGSREDAEEWLDQRLDIDPDDCDIAEMDEDEEEEFLENQAEAEVDPEAGSLEFERGRGDYASIHATDDKIPDGDEADIDILGEIFDGDDEDLDEGRSEDDEEDSDEDEEDI